MIEKSHPFESDILCMEKLYDLITEKDNTLDSLKKERDELSHNMANPRVINDNAQQIKDTERAISLLCDALELAEEKGVNPDANPEEILEDVKNHLEDMKEDAVNSEKVLNDLEKDLHILKNIVENDLNNSGTQESSDDATSSAVDLHNTDISSFSDFDDF